MLGGLRRGRGFIGLVALLWAAASAPATYRTNSDAIFQASCYISFPLPPLQEIVDETDTHHDNLKQHRVAKSQLASGSPRMRALLQQYQTAATMEAGFSGGLGVQGRSCTELLCVHAAAVQPRASLQADLHPSLQEASSLAPAAVGAACLVALALARYRYPCLQQQGSLLSGAKSSSLTLPSTLITLVQTLQSC